MKGVVKGGRNTRLTVAPPYKMTDIYQKDMAKKHCTHSGAGTCRRQRLLFFFCVSNGVMMGASIIRSNAPVNWTKLVK